MTDLFRLGFDKIAEYLIKKEADVNAVGQDGNTPLIWSVYNGKKKFFYICQINNLMASDM